MVPTVQRGATTEVTFVVNSTEEANVQAGWVWAKEVEQEELGMWATRMEEWWPRSQDQSSEILRRFSDYTGVRGCGEMARRSLVARGGV